MPFPACVRTENCLGYTLELVHLATSQQPSVAVCLGTPPWLLRRVTTLTGVPRAGETATKNSRTLAGQSAPQARYT